MSQCPHCGGELGDELELAVRMNELEAERLRPVPLPGTWPS